jgi:hypothetical protein
MLIFFKSGQVKIDDIDIETCLDQESQLRAHWDKSWPLGSVLKEEYIALSDLIQNEPNQPNLVITKPNLNKPNLT